MNDLSMHIGALEIAARGTGYSDAVLETAAVMSAGPTPGFGCPAGPINPHTIYRCVSDGELESAGATSATPFTQLGPGSPCTLGNYPCR